MPSKLIKRYAINQSPFYKLRNRRKLAALLGMKLSDLESIAAGDENYRIWPLENETGKTRIIEEPKQHTKLLHIRIFNLLSRIETPDYLHSGVKTKSYITNAKAHLDGDRLITLDVRKFFPSTKGWHVFHFFTSTMKCSRDVAGLLVKLTTVNGHLPTGSCISQSLAFWAHIEMFDEIQAVAIKNNLVFTVYVDDLTISGRKATKRVLHEIRTILASRALKSHPKKESVYMGNEARSVTGSIICDNQLRLPNAKHKRIHEELLELSTIDDRELKLERQKRVIGKLVAAIQSDSTMKPQLERLLADRKSLSMNC